MTGVQTCALPIFLSSLSLAPLSPSFPCGFSSLLVVTIRSEIEFWVCGGCDRVLVFVFVHVFGGCGSGG